MQTTFNDVKPYLSLVKQAVAERFDVPENMELFYREMQVRYCYVMYSDPENVRIVLMNSGALPLPITKKTEFSMYERVRVF